MQTINPTDTAWFFPSATSGSSVTSGVQVVVPAWWTGLVVGMGLILRI